MIIADTNVWISYFKGERKSLILRELILENQIILHPYIFGELLFCGINETTESLLQKVLMAEIAEPSIVYRFITVHNLKNRGIGWVDVNIVISALAGSFPVYTYDENLKVVCNELGCMYR